MTQGYKHEDGSINYDLDDNWRTLSEAAATLIVAAYDPTIEGKHSSLYDMTDT